MPQPKLNFGPIADAFARVIIVADYQGTWINAADFARIVNYEHGLSSPASMVDSDTLVAALSMDFRYKHADDTSGASGVFRKLYYPRILKTRWNQQSTRVHCYFVGGVKNSVPDATKGECWYKGVTSLGRLRQRRCTIQNARMRDLATCMEELHRKKQAGKQRLGTLTLVGDVTAPQGDVAPPTDDRMSSSMGLFPSAGRTKRPVEEPPPSLVPQQSKKSHKADANKGVLAAMSPVSGAATKLRPNKSKPVSWIDRETLKGPSRSDKFRTGMKYLVPCAIQGATRDVV
jgi:hypothetical protein